MDKNNNSIPLNQYPRPQLERKEWICLNGYWDFTVQPTEERKPDNFNEKILVPFSIETPLSEVKRGLKPTETLWYRKTFMHPDNWKNKRTILNFEAVDYKCVCYINGYKAGSHEGGYIPFSFDITEFITDSENVILLEVTDPTDSENIQKGKQVLNPATKYYTATSGIWQTVWLEPVPYENHIIDYSVSAEIETGKIEVTVKTKSQAKITARVSLKGNLEETFSFNSDTSKALTIQDHKLWSPDNPFLYNITLKTDGNDADEVSGYFAFREISIQNAPSGKKRIHLNGKPVFLHAPLDQGYWPDSGLTPPTEEAIIFDLEQIKELGFNSVRKHIKIEPRRWYYHADKMGIMVIQDMVSGGKNSVGDIKTILTMVFGIKADDKKQSFYIKSGRNSLDNRNTFIKELSEMITHLKKHPSIIMWVPFNESWGQFDSTKIGELTENLDPTRLVDRTSGWYDQGGGIFNSVHTYFTKLRKPSAKDKRVYFISEYGGYNLPVKEHNWNDKKHFGYRNCSSPADFEKSYSNLIRKQLIPLIKNGLSAAVYTQLTDVEIENNGFFTYDRKVLKIEKKLVYNLNNEIYDKFNRIEKIV
ncbi:MAG: glycoside hydrolase family 2 TIM barrel-domain containing protein [Spirochaetales bacterium]|nr:glycoside hydrolase family 2 TIM barrel-domain containing protein [Spirochaetales bacterium]